MPGHRKWQQQQQQPKQQQEQRSTIYLGMADWSKGAPTMRYECKEDMQGDDSNENMHCDCKENTEQIGGQLK